MPGGTASSPGPLHWYAQPHTATFPADTTPHDPACARPSAAHHTPPSPQEWLVGDPDARFTAAQLQQRGHSLYGVDPTYERSLGEPGDEPTLDRVMPPLFEVVMTKYPRQGGVSKSHQHSHASGLADKLLLMACYANRDSSMQPMDPELFQALLAR